MLKNQTLRRLLKFVKPYGGYIFCAFFSALIGVSLSLLAPILVGDAIDFIVGPGQVDFHQVWIFVLQLIVVILISGLFQWLMTLFTSIITQKTVKDLRVSLFNRLSQVPLRYLDSHSNGDFVSRVVNDVDQVSEGLLQGLTQLFTGVITILGTLIFMLSVSPVITVVVVILTPLSFFVANFIASHCADSFKIQAKTVGTLSGYIEEMVGNQKIVKAFSHEQKAQEEFEKVNQELYHCGVRAQFFSSMTNPCTRFVNGIVYAMTGIIGALSVIRGTLSVGQLSCFLTYANQYTKPFNEITSVITQLQSAMASAVRIFEVLDEPIETENATKTLTNCQGRVTIDHVNFSYSKEKPLIENLNLLVHPGNRIAIVGPTGCGKTTIINLLMRFYDVDSGTIFVDGNNISELTRSSLRTSYGMVLQDTWLKNGTVRENISYGKPDASLDEVIAAAKAAHVHGFIKRLPQGYDTVLSENGSNISEGQKQLLCIARVMLLDPPMLILDEATSNIDTRTEIRVQKAFAAMMKGRTTFIVAHRLSTIKEADTILVMNQGKIIEQGTHDELLKNQGFYANLYQSQFAVD